MNSMSDSLVQLPRALYSAAQVRQLDSIAISQFGLPGFELMGIAASTVLQATLERWPQTRFLRVFAGSGNNAGDGFLVAALAKQQSIPCQVVLVGETAKLGPDGKLAYDKAVSVGVPIITLAEYVAKRFLNSHPNCIEIDALLGTGLDRQVAGDYLTAIEDINASKNPVVAIDIPSGLNADTGMPMGTAVLANLTVTFIGMKQGLLTGQGRDYSGEIWFSDLDIPEQVYTVADAPTPFARRIDINFASKHLTKRNQSSHKGSNGHVVVVGGDIQYGGAVILAAEAALRAGAGLVSVISRSCHRSAALARRPELMWQGTEDKLGSDAEAKQNLETRVGELMTKASAIVIGPGLGRSGWAQALFNQALSSSRANNTPLVIDADGLHLLRDRLDASASFSGKWVLTPHPGEAAALLGISVAAIQQDRFAAVSQLSNIYRGSCLLKGSGSLISHAARPAHIQLCSEGNPGMGTGGMGDLLAGVIGALISQGLSIEDSLSCGVCIHGEAGDLASEVEGERGMLATDLLPWIKELVNPS